MQKLPFHVPSWDMDPKQGLQVKKERLALNCSENIQSTSKAQCLSGHLLEFTAQRLNLGQNSMSIKLLIPHSLSKEVNHGQFQHKIRH